MGRRFPRNVAQATRDNGPVIIEFSLSAQSADGEFTDRPHAWVVRAGSPADPDEAGSWREIDSLPPEDGPPQPKRGNTINEVVTYYHDLQRKFANEDGDDAVPANLILHFYPGGIEDVVLQEPPMSGSETASDSESEIETGSETTSEQTDNSEFNSDEWEEVIVSGAASSVASGAGSRNEGR